MRNMSGEILVHDSQSSLTRSELENGLLVRKSQRTPKKKVIKSFGITVKKKNTRTRRIESSKIKKRLPEKKKIIQSQRQQMKSHTTPYVTRANKSQKSKHSENNTKNHITSKLSHSMKSKVPIKINKINEKKPDHIIRYDEIAHLPGVDIETRRRCKLEGCTQLTYVYCEKCNVHLCINIRRNCFKEFHILPIDTTSSDSPLYEYINMI